MKVSEYTSRKIARLSIVCACLVVFLHSYSKPLSQSMSGSVAWWAQDLISQGISRAAVPFFFVVFGFFLFRDYEPRNSQWGWWKRQVSKRLRSLCVPYFVWSLIGLLSTFTMTRFATTQIYSYEWASPTWWLSVLGVTTFPKFMFHLWFVKALFIFTLISPIIAAIAFRWPRLTLLMLFLLSVVRFVPFGDWPSNLMFVVVGIAAIIFSRVERAECVGVGRVERVDCVGVGRVERVDCVGVGRIERAERVESESFPTRSTRSTRLRRLKMCGGIIWLFLVFCKVLLTKLGIVDIYGSIRLSDMFQINIMTPMNMLGIAVLWYGYDKIVGHLSLRVIHLWDRVAPLAFFVYCFHWSIQHWVSAVVGRVLMGRSDLLMWVLPPTITSILGLWCGSLFSSKIPLIVSFLTGGRCSPRR